MTSGLFNTGFAGDPQHEITSNPPVITTSITAPHPPHNPLPEPSMSNKVIRCHDDFLARALPAGDDDNNDLGLDMDDFFGDLGGAGVGTFDPLGDASLDSFIDLSALLSEENAFLDPAHLEAAAVEMPDSTSTHDAKPSTSTTTTATAPTSLKRKYDQMEAGSTIDFSTLSDCLASTNNNVITITTPTATTTVNTNDTAAVSPNLDHDYSSKRPRMSTPATEEPATAVNVFRFPTPPPHPPSATITSASLPGPSTSSFMGSSPVDKTRHRREKNNVASKRSREIRKQKFASMESEAENLIEDNARLERKVAQLEDLAKRMKEILVAKMAGK